MSYHQLLLRLNQCFDTFEAKAILRLVLESRFRMSWTEVLCGGVDHLDDSQLKDLEFIIQRLEQGCPVQYILGEAEFCGNDFHVAPGVLIPRPETETLIDQVTGDARPDLRVLDIGTGSGCIAITLALQHPGWQVQGWDISPDALAIAAGNAQRLSASNVSFFQQDILCVAHQDNSDSHVIAPDAAWDLIVSNPPYICEREEADMEAVVLEHEPRLALFVPDDDPLLFYRHISHFAQGHLNPGGILAFEINRAYGDDVSKLMKNCGFIDISVVKDQYGNDRVVKGSLL